MRILRAGIGLLAVSAIGFVGACAANRPGGAAIQQDRITNEELTNVQGARNLWDVVERLRPRWLQVRAGERSLGLPTNIVVFQEQAYLGDTDALHQLSPDVAYELRWLDGPTASSTLPGLGSQHVAGAIVIYTRPR